MIDLVKLNIRIRFALTLLVSILASLPYVVFSQVDQRERTLALQIAVEEKLINQPSQAEGNVLFLKQTGYENQVFLQQLGSSKDLIQQGGHSNLVSLNQYLTGGQFNVRQRGTANQYKGLAIGADIETSLLQQGNFNSVIQKLAGNQLMFGIIQEGNYNEIQQTAQNSSTPLQIYQRGNDMKLIIKAHN